jgi:hypothetical protein
VLPSHVSACWSEGKNAGSPKPPKLGLNTRSLAVAAGSRLAKRLIPNPSGSLDVEVTSRLRPEGCT